MLVFTSFVLEGRIDQIAEGRRAMLLDKGFSDLSDVYSVWCTSPFCTKYNPLKHLPASWTCRRIGEWLMRAGFILMTITGSTKARAPLTQR